MILSTAAWPTQTLPPRPVKESNAAHVNIEGDQDSAVTMLMLKFWVWVLLLEISMKLETNPPIFDLFKLLTLIPVS